MYVSVTATHATHATAATAATNPTLLKNTALWLEELPRHHGECSFRLWANDEEASGSDQKCTRCLEGQVDVEVGVDAAAGSLEKN